MVRFLVFLLFLLTLQVGNGQQKSYRFSHISSADGLSQSSVIAFAEDDLGQIWMGTRNGLNKYDGSKITIYRKNAEGDYNLSNNDILSLKNDGRGNLWIGTAEGLNRYNFKSDKFEVYLADASQKSLLHNRVLCIEQCSDHELWLGTPIGLSIYDPTAATFSSYLKGRVVASIYKSGDSTIFIGTDRGLAIAHKSPSGGYAFKFVEETGDFFIQDIVEDRFGKILLGTKQDGVQMYDPSSREVGAYLKPNHQAQINKDVRELLFDDSHNLWVGTYKGLSVVSAEGNLTKIKSDARDETSLSSNAIMTMFKDDDGIIWVGTYYGGVNFYNQNNLNFKNFVPISEQRGLRFKVVSSICSFKNLLVYGTEGGGVTIYDTIADQYSYLTAKRFKKLGSDNVKALFITAEGILWIGTFTGEIAVYDLIEKEFVATPISSALKAYLKGQSINAIDANAQGVIFIGLAGKGLVSFDQENENHEEEKVNRIMGLTNPFVQTIEVDSQDNVWIGTLNGVNVLRPSGEIEQFSYHQNSIRNIISVIFEDEHMNIWVGSDSEGLLKLENGNLIHKQLMDNTGETIEGVKSIEQDEKGNLWMGTTFQGIVKYNINDGRVATYTVQDGIISNEFNRNASLHSKNGYMYFGGWEGVVGISPNAIAAQKTTQQVIMTDFKINNKSVSVGSDLGILDKNIAYTNDLTLAYDQGNFTLSFSVPEFVRGNRNRYKYRLQGVDQDWIYTAKNTVSYTIQDPGTYDFEVYGINNEGVPSSRPAFLSIKIKPAPWFTWYAILCYVLVVALIGGYLLALFRSRSKLKRELMLEQVAVEQTQKLSQERLNFFTNISHEFRTPLTLIIGPLEHILEDFKGGTKLYKKLKVIQGNARQLLQLINRLMDFRKLENNLVKLEASEGNIVQTVKEVFLSFQEYANDGGYRYNFVSAQKEIPVFFDRYKLERVFYNLISNAFRYTPKGGEIILRVFTRKDKAVIEIQDTGVGIADENKAKIFDPFFQMPIDKNPEREYLEGSGIGLSLVKSMLELHKATIEVRDNYSGTGTVFSICMPLGKEHLKASEIVAHVADADSLSHYTSHLPKTQPKTLPKVVSSQVAGEDKAHAILVVEDNNNLRNFLYEVLAEHYKVYQAANGKSALSIIKDQEIDLIISDVVMPQMTGTELCAKLKTDLTTSHIPVILLTSRSSIVYRLEGLENGADHYISKPFDVQELKLKIRNTFQGVSRLQQKLNARQLQDNDTVLPSSLDEKLYKKALNIVHENLSNEQFDIMTFSETLGVSRTDLFRKIKAWTDQTPNEFIQQERLKYAAELLSNQRLRISEVSHKVGFKNPKYFSSRFKAKFGKTPSAYRKAL